MAILDKRLEDDDDDSDTSGIELGFERLGTVPKLVLTRFPSYQSVREVMGMQQRSTETFLDYVNKEEGMDRVIEAVRRSIGGPENLVAARIGKGWRWMLGAPTFVLLGALGAGVGTIAFEDPRWLFATIVLCGIALVLGVVGREW
jgi:hypothetical protein